MHDTDEDSVPTSSSQSWSSTGHSATLTLSDALNLLSISPNFVTADELAQLALAAADSGFVLEGVVVVNPDPTDNHDRLDEGRHGPSAAVRVPVPMPVSDEEVHLGARTSQTGNSPERLTTPGALMDVNDIATTTRPWAR